jgi:hypothetical protein
VDEVNQLPEKGKEKAEAASMDEMHKHPEQPESAAFLFANLCWPCL